jgi:ribosomal protein S18 acetylase RimI-like enzyme
MDIKIVEATLKDIDAIMEFEKKCFPCVTDRFPKRNLRHQIKSDKCRITVIKNKKGEVCASATGFLRHFKTPSGRIYKIGVLSELKQRGIGSRLLQEMEAWFVKNKMLDTYAEVRESNKPSRNMFQKNGYEEIKKLTCYYGNLKEGLELEDGYKYKKSLKKIKGN